MPSSVTIARDALLPVLTRRDDQVLGAVLDLHTGDVRTLFDPLRSGHDNAALEAMIDLEPERYTRVPSYDREYRLMCAFAADVVDDDLAHELDVALTGKGAFSAFNEVLDGAGALDGWSAYREQALLRFAEDWLATLGVQVTWNPPAVAHRPPGPEPGLLTLLALGRPQPGEDPEVLVRELVLRSEAAARQVFVRAARDLCELGGRPWRRAYVRGRERFRTDGVLIEVDGPALRVCIQLTPAWRALIP